MKKKKKKKTFANETLGLNSLTFQYRKCEERMKQVRMKQQRIIDYRAKFSIVD
jgi:hypothetical protein